MTPRPWAGGYQQHFGVDPVPSSYGQPSWTQQAGPTAFAPFAKDTNYFGRNPQQSWMINFRVRDLGAMVAQLRGAGIEAVVYPEVYSISRFARLHDPGSNPVELWELEAVG